MILRITIKRTHEDCRYILKLGALLSDSDGNHCSFQRANSSVPTKKTFCMLLFVLLVLCFQKAFGIQCFYEAPYNSL